MLRIVQQVNAAAAKQYYARADYYLAEGPALELTGNWGGKGAALLGLSGQVDRASFESLCDNLHPQTGEQLTARTRADRTVLYDFNFHVPKSVSVLYELTEDRRILDGFRAAVHETMQEAEREMKTRVRKRGEEGDRTTGNMAWAEFVHFTSRPAREDGKPDPLLHAHVCVVNATWDPAEKHWKAGQFRDLKRDAPYWQAAFHARLAGKLADLGYGVERRGKGWEIAGVPHGIVRKFSRRKEEVERLARDLGITDPDKKAELGARSRAHKDKELTREELRAYWLGRLDEGEKHALRDVSEQAGQQGWRAPVQKDREAMAHAVSHCFTRDCVVAEKDLLAEALRFGVGSVSVAGVRRELSGHGILRRERDGRMLATTRPVLEEERALLAFARDGRGVCRPLGRKGRPLTRAWLNDGQKNAVRHVLESGDRVMIIRGAAGTGKTSLMQEAVEGIEASGHKVFTFAPGSEAARGVLRRAGFPDAETVAALLASKQMQKAIRGQVLWIDEAGQLGQRDMARVFELARQHDARVILSGDRRQHGSVPRGAALRVLEEQAGIVPASVTEIKRQTHGGYKAAVAALSEGHTAEGFDRLDALGWIREVPDDQRHGLLVADYLEAVEEGRTALVVSPTHAEGEKVTAAIRAGLKERGLLGKEECAFLRLDNLGLTEAERADPVQYQAWDRPGVVQWLQNAKGFRRGERLTVAGVEGGTVLVTGPGGETRTLPLDQAERFQLYRAGSVNLAPGDQVRVTQNGFTLDRQHRLNNGAAYGVAGFTPEGDVRLDNGWVVGKDFGFLAHAYAVTSHASQGRDVQRVFIAQGAESLPASSREQFYVSVSRGREKAVIYTDDRAALRRAVLHGETRLSATELLQRRNASRLARLRRHVFFLQRQVAEARAHTSRMVDKARGAARESGKEWERSHER